MNHSAIDNPMVCDLDSGLCGPAQQQERTVTVTVVTDPICSACWAMEPAWRAARYHYGDLFDVRHIYGGLLPGWDGFADAGNGIHGPADVAGHWQQVAEYSGQALNNAVWFDDPIASSYPPSMVLAAVRDIAPEREDRALRKIREELFVYGRNITRPAVWQRAVAAAGVDVAAVDERMRDGRAAAAFRADLQLSRRLGATSFPTVIVEAGTDRMTLRGVQSLVRLEAAITAAAEVPAGRAPVSLQAAIDYLGVGTTAEYSELLGQPAKRVESALAGAGLRPINLPGGNAWTL